MSKSVRLPGNPPPAPPWWQLMFWDKLNHFGPGAKAARPCPGKRD